MQNYEGNMGLLGKISSKTVLPPKDTHTKSEVISIISRFTKHIHNIITAERKRNPNKKHRLMTRKQIDANMMRITDNATRRTIRLTTKERMSLLYNNYCHLNNKQINKESYCSFTEIISNIARVYDYKNKKHTKKIPDQIYNILIRFFKIETETMASPFDFNVNLNSYFSPIDIDTKIGSKGNAFHHFWNKNSIIHPSYNIPNIAKTIIYAIKSVQKYNSKHILCIPLWSNPDIYEKCDYRPFLKHKYVKRIYAWSRNQFRYQSTQTNQLMRPTSLPIGIYIITKHHTNIKELNITMNKISKKIFNEHTYTDRIAEFDTMMKHLNSNINENTESWKDLPIYLKLDYNRPDGADTGKHTQNKQINTIIEASTLNNTLQELNINIDIENEILRNHSIIQEEDFIKPEDSKPEDSRQLDASEDTQDLIIGDDTDPALNGDLNILIDKLHQGLEDALKIKEIAVIHKLDKGGAQLCIE